MPSVSDNVFIVMFITLRNWEAKLSTLAYGSVSHVRTVQVLHTNVNVWLRNVQYYAGQSIYAYFQLRKSYILQIPHSTWFVDVNEM
jgi:hypothetical protein